MKRFLYTIFILFILTPSKIYSQDNMKLFNQYINKFRACNFPIADKTLGDYKLYSNNTGNLSKKEFDSFVFDKSDVFWEYKNYSKINNKNFFNYVAGVKFYFYENYIGIIVLKAFFSDDILSEKTESFLCIFNKLGVKISSLPISGNYGDTLTFDFKIYSPERIEINYTKYTDNAETKYTKYYCIQKDGKIVSKK